MTLHPPKRISSSSGLGVNTAKSMRLISRTIGIGTEIWPKMKEPWREGNTVIAAEDYTWVTKWETGRPYIINKFYSAKGLLIGVYCDITRPIQRTADGFEFDDLYLDVWQTPGAHPIILDEDELIAALAAGYISASEAKQAKKTARYLMNELVTNKQLIDF